MAVGNPLTVSSFVSILSINPWIYSGLRIEFFVCDLLYGVFAWRIICSVYPTKIERNFYKIKKCRAPLLHRDHMWEDLVEKVVTGLRYQQHGHRQVSEHKFHYCFITLLMYLWLSFFSELQINCVDVTSSCSTNFVVIFKD